MKTTARSLCKSRTTLRIAGESKSLRAKTSIVEFKTIEMLCDLVKAAAGKAEIVDLAALAKTIARS